MTTQLTDPKEKLAFMERVADEYLKWRDGGVVYSPVERCFYMYNDNTGAWYKRNLERRQGGKLMYNELIAFLRAYGLYENKFTNYSRLQQEVFKLQALLENNNAVVGAFPNDRYHNFQDCIYDIKDGKRIQHTNDIKYFTNYQYLFSIGEEPEGDIQFTGALDKLFKGAVEYDPEKMLMLSQMFGTAISDVRFPVMYVLIGMQQTAKSTFLRLLREFVGRERVGEAPLENFAGSGASRFGLAKAVIGKKVNISEEIKEDKLDSSKIKTMISEDRLEVERKGVDAVDILFNTRFYGTSNNVLSFEGGTEGIDRRMKYIVFTRQIPSNEVDVNIIDKIVSNEQNMRELWWFAVRGYRSIIDNMSKEYDNLYWFNGFFQNQDSIDAKIEVQEVSRPTYAFLRSINFKYIGGDDDFIVCKELRDWYSEWAEEEGHARSANISQVAFNRQVKEYLQATQNVPFHKLKEIIKHKGDRSNRQRAFVGVVSDPKPTHIW